MTPMDRVGVFQAGSVRQQLKPGRIAKKPVAEPGEIALIAYGD